MRALNGYLTTARLNLAVTLMCLFGLLAVNSSSHASTALPSTLSSTTTQATVHSSILRASPVLILDAKHELGVPKIIHLDNYLQKRITGSPVPTYRDTLDRYSDSWRPFSQTKRALFGDLKQHWYRLQLNNKSSQHQHYILSATPASVLTVKAAIIADDFLQAQPNITLASPVEMKSIFERNSNLSHAIDLPVTLRGNENATLLISITTDNWVIPSFSFNTPEQLNTSRIVEKNYWMVLTGVLLAMIFFIISAGLITKQGGLLWLLCYSIASINLVPNFLASNLQGLGLTSHDMSKLSIVAGNVAIVAFIGVLKYIFYNFDFLQRIKNRYLICVMFVVAVLSIISPLIIANAFLQIVLTSQVFFTLLLSIKAYAQGHQSIATAIGPIKLALLFLVIFTVYQAEHGALSGNQFELWLASAIMLDAAFLNIVLLSIDRTRREAMLFISINAAKKEQQVATISPLLGNSRHDLRASLSDIIGLSELIIESPLDYSQQKNIIDIQRSGRKALDHINQLFSFQGQDKREIQNQEPFNLSALLSECTQYYGNQADQLKKEIIIDIAADFPDYWTGSHEQIRQIMMHILEHFLDNSDFQDLRIKPANHSSQSLDIIFSLISSKNNINKPIDKVADISIAKIIVQKLGGQLDIEHYPDRWLLTVNIPAMINDNQSKQHFDLDLLRNRRVIIIDDSKTSCDVIESYLARWDITTFKAHNFNDALAIIHHQASIEQNIDLALIDFVMPNIDGITASQRLRADPEVPGDLSIIIMSNAASFIDLNIAKNHGVKRVLDKPVLAHTLQLVLLEEFFFLRSLADEAKSISLKEQTPDALTDETPNAIDNEINVLLVEDNPVSAKIVCVMLNRLSLKYSHVKTGEEALAKVQTERFHIVLMDCDLPDESGFTTTRKIRDHQRNNNNMNKSPISIIALTAYDNAESYQQSVDAGMNDYLSKPINLTQLDKIISKALAEQLHHRH